MLKSMQKREFENLFPAARIGALVGMLGCYVATLAGFVELTSPLNVVTMFLFSTAAIALLGGAFGLFFDLTKNCND